MLSVNDRVDIPSRYQTNCGRVRYIGEVNFGDDDSEVDRPYGHSQDEDNVWVGIELDSPWGNTDGSVDVRYMRLSLQEFGIFNTFLY